MTFHKPQAFTVVLQYYFYFVSWMQCKRPCLLLSPAVVMVCFLRYAQVIEHSHRCWINTSALVSGCTNAVGLVMVGNFQVDFLQRIC